MIVIPERGVVSNMTRQSIITAALCRSKSDVVFKDDGKKISLQKPNIELSSSSSVRLIDHHQQLFKIPVDALSKLLHDAVLEQETQLPAATAVMTFLTPLPALSTLLFDLLWFGAE